MIINRGWLLPIPITEEERQRLEKGDNIMIIKNDWLLPILAEEEVREDGQIVCFIPLDLMADETHYVKPMLDSEFVYINPSAGHRFLEQFERLDIEDMSDQAFGKLLSNVLSWLEQSGMTIEMGIPVISYEGENCVMVRSVEIYSEDRTIIEVTDLPVIFNADMGDDGTVWYREGEVLLWTDEDFDRVDAALGDE